MLLKYSVKAAAEKVIGRLAPVKSGAYSDARTAACSSSESCEPDSSTEIASISSVNLFSTGINGVSLLLLSGGWPYMVLLTGTGGSSNLFEMTA